MQIPHIIPRIGNANGAYVVPAYKRLVNFGLGAEDPFGLFDVFSPRLRKVRHLYVQGYDVGFPVSIHIFVNIYYETCWDDLCSTAWTEIGRQRRSI